MADPAVFSGFNKETVRFFNGLRRNNDRDWFAKHREVYDNQVMEPAKAFVVAMGERLRRAVPGIVAVPMINKSIFRINRDTRFSLDPSPYKTNLGLYFWEGRRSRMVRPVRDLEQNPRPSGCRKLSGKDRYRLRQGDYRIVYAVDDSRRIVGVFKIGNRREIYRD